MKTIRVQRLAVLSMLWALAGGGCPAVESGVSTDGPGTSSGTSPASETGGVTTGVTGTSTDGTGTTSPSTTEASTGTTTSDAGCGAGKTNVDDCCCFRRVDDGSGGLSFENDCPRPPALCGDIFYDLEAGQFEDPTAVTCSIEALRDNKIGSLSWREEAMYDWSVTVLYVQGDGTVFVVRQWGGDVGSGSFWVGQMLLEFPEYFDACLALGTSVERYECLKGFDQGTPKFCIDSEPAFPFPSSP